MKKQFILKSIITLALLGSFLGCETVSEHCQNNPFDASCPKSSSSDGKNRDENGEGIDGLGEMISGATEAGDYGINTSIATLEVVPYQAGYTIEIMPIDGEPIFTCQYKIGHFVMQDGKKYCIGNPGQDITKECAGRFCNTYNGNTIEEIYSKEAGFDPNKPYTVNFDCVNSSGCKIEIKP